MPLVWKFMHDDFFFEILKEKKFSFRKRCKVVIYNKFVLTLIPCQI